MVKSVEKHTLKLLPKLLDCCSVVLNISYLRMSASVTDRLAKRMASSKCSLIVNIVPGIARHVCLHSDSRHIVLVVLFVHEVDVNILSSGLGLLLLLSDSTHVAFDTGSDGELGSSLADLGEIGTRETSGALGQEVQIDTRCER